MMNQTRTRGHARRLLACIAAVLLALPCISAVGETASAQIVFSEGGVQSTDRQMLINGSIVTISTGGVYEISGSCADGQIRVTTPKNVEVELVLNGLTLSCSTGPALWGDTDHLTLTMAPGSTNELRDSEERTVPSSEKIPKAAVYASDDMTIQGAGSLKVVSLIGHAIHCKDVLTISEATLDVNAENDGLRGNDGVTVESGSITIRARGDGIQSSNADDGKGQVTIEGGTLNITANKDGIQAAGVLQITGGSLTIRAGLGD